MLHDAWLCLSVQGYVPSFRSRPFPLCLFCPVRVKYTCVYRSKLSINTHTPFVEYVFESKMLLPPPLCKPSHLCCSVNWSNNEVLWNLQSAIISKVSIVLECLCEENEGLILFFLITIMMWTETSVVRTTQPWLLLQLMLTFDASDSQLWYHGVFVIMWKIHQWICALKELISKMILNICLKLCNYE